MMPKEAWSTHKVAADWIAKVPVKASVGEPAKNSTVQSLEALLMEFEPRKDDFMTVLEVGAGTGRLIGELSRKYTRNVCRSVDINPVLSAYVQEHYPTVLRSDVGEVVNLPYKDKSYDLVYTFQVLQHVHPDEIQKALSELQRVARKEVWLMEGYDLRSADRTNGEMTHPADGGTFAYYFDTMPEIKCYDSYFLKSPVYEMRDVKIYKIYVESKTKA